MGISVLTEVIGKKLHRLRMFHGGQYIGEYERSQEADIERKKAEVLAASDLLLALFEKHGELCVRWNGEARKKSVRAGGPKGIEVGVIPEQCWQRASWQR